MNAPAQVPALPGWTNRLGATWGKARTWLARADLDAMPRRVAESIDAQRRENEVLVGWVQVVLVVVLATLYALSRKTFPPDAPFQPVPWALGIYACFTVWRLYRAYVGRLTHAMLMLSVFVDIAVLMLTIWSFHIQYGQPAAFYLKAPTLLYIFIFIALRTLSIAPGYVLLAGISAAAGWLALLGFALMEPGGMALLTRDYVSYMTSPRVLLGGEIDKVVSILVVAVLLTVATARSRTLLYRAVAEEAAAAQLTRFFAPEVAATIVGAEDELRPGQGRQTEAAAMFIDMRGFTRLAASLAPRDLIALLGEYQNIAVPAIHANRGSIITFLGDGIMVTFGAPRNSASYAADAFRCAEALLDALGAWAARRAAEGHPAPGVGIGITVGTVTCGAVGNESRLEYAVIGDPVNRAAKLQNHTKAESVRALATRHALERAREQGYEGTRAATRLDARKVAGVEEPLDLVVID